MKNVPRIIVAGTQSGVGKTSVSLALMAAFRKSGLRVQAFKVGPDYIDPSYHEVATGFPSHNLDSWLCSHETLKWLFQTKSEQADISIIEGVMGLYDGFGGKDETASTAQIAKLLKAPVILVLDARSLARSVSAIILGYKSFDKNLNICGVILNKVGSERHLELLKESIEHYTKVPILGAIFRDEKIKIPERHLGLVTASENKELRNCLDNLAQLTKGIDLKKIMNIAKKATVLPDSNSVILTSSRIHAEQDRMTKPAGKKEAKVRIALARDRAFNFYYQVNLDLLKELGAELVPFSPLEDKKIPEACSAIYFGGGFPEIFARELAENKKLKVQIRKKIESGMPVYAECGGLMYLSQSLETLDGKSYAMAAAIPGRVAMTKKLQNFGYKQGKMMGSTILGARGQSVRGHEFHYSRRAVGKRETHKNAYELTGRGNGKAQLEGTVKNSLLASYLHLHFLSNPDWAKKFVGYAKNYNQTHSQ